MDVLTPAVVPQITMQILANLNSGGSKLYVGRYDHFPLFLSKHITDEDLPRKLGFKLSVLPTDNFRGTL
jgi:hypothetical protein